VTVVATADIFDTATGCFNVLTAEQMGKMKDKAIVGNIGHFDNEIDMAGLAKILGITKTEIKPQVHEWTFSTKADGSISSIIVLSEGCLLNLSNATGHPSFVMSNSFTNQTMAQIELWTKPGDYKNEVYVLPKHLDEKVARLHLDALGVRLTELTKVEAEYLGVDVAGPTRRTSTDTDPLASFGRNSTRRYAVRSPERAAYLRPCVESLAAVTVPTAFATIGDERTLIWSEQRDHQPGNQAHAALTTTRTGSGRRRGSPRCSAGCSWS